MGGFVPPRPDEWEGPSKASGQFTPPSPNSWQGPAATARPYTPAEVQQHFRTYAPAQAEYKDLGPLGAVPWPKNPWESFGRGAWETAKGVVKSTVVDPLAAEWEASKDPGYFLPGAAAAKTIAKGLVGAQLEQAEKAAQTTGIERAGHVLASAIPMVGPMAAAFGEKLAENPPEAAGMAAGLAATAAAPKVIGRAGKVVARGVGGAGEFNTKAAAVRAFGPPGSQSRFTDIAPEAFDDIATFSGKGRKIPTNEEMLPAGRKAKSVLQDDALESWLDRAEKAGATRNGRPLVVAANDAIPFIDKLSANDQIIAGKLLDEAHEKFNRDFTPRELRRVVKELNAKNEAFRKQRLATTTAEMIAGSPEAITEAQLGAARQLLNEMLHPEGKGVGPEEIQRRTGQVIEILERGQERRNAIIGEKPLTPVGAAAKFVAGVANMPGKVIHGDIEGAVGGMTHPIVGKSDALIRRIFANTKKAKPLPVPPGEYPKWALREPSPSEVPPFGTVPPLFTQEPPAPSEAPPIAAAPPTQAPPVITAAARTPAEASAMVTPESLARLAELRQLQSTWENKAQQMFGKPYSQLGEVSRMEVRQAIETGVTPKRPVVPEAEPVAPAPATAQSETPAAVTPAASEPRLGSDVTPAPPSEPPVTAEPAPESAAPEPAPIPTGPAGRMAEGTFFPQSETEVPGPAEVSRMKREDLALDPERFQFKAEAVGQGGVSEKYKGVEYDPNKAGPIHVWRDPADGKVYVVNGHHRYEMATRSNYPTLDVKFLKAADASEARTQGAILNLSEGRGTAIDAATLFREKNITPEQFTELRLNPKEKIVQQGAELAKLEPGLFRMVVNEEMTPERGVIIGRELGDNPVQQEALMSMLKRQDREFTDRQVENLIKLARGSKAVESAQGVLFGNAAQESTLAATAKFMDKIRNRLSSDKRLFKAASQGEGRLSEAGNVMAGEANKAIADAASQALAVYDKLAYRASAINDVLTKAGEEIANGAKAKDIEERVYGQVRDAVSQELGVGRLQSAEGPAGQASGRGQNQGPGTAANPESSPRFQSAIKPGAGTTQRPEFLDLFGEETPKLAAEQAAAEEAGKQKLQGDRLTAEFNSPVTAANRRKKLKPGQQPAQESFFGETEEPPQAKFDFKRDLVERGATKEFNRPFDPENLDQSVQAATYRIYPETPKFPARLYVDQTASAILNGAINKVTGEKSIRSGARLGPAQALAIMNVLDGVGAKPAGNLSAAAFNKLSQMAGDLEQAMAKNPKGVVIVEAVSGKPIAEIKGTARHESAHYEQAKVQGEWSPVKANRPLFHYDTGVKEIPNYGVASRNLTKRGYPANHEVLVNEILSAASERQYDPKTGRNSIGLNPDEMADTLLSIVNKSKEVHGDAAYGLLAHVGPSMKARVRAKAASQGATELPAFAAGGVIPKGQKGLTGEAGPERVTQLSNASAKSGEDIIRGSSNIPLSPQGLEQAKELGQRFAAKGGLDKIVSSDLLRAKQTAEAISDATGAPVSYTGALRPWHLGEIEGQPTAKVLARINEFIRTKPDQKVPGRGELSTSDGESFDAFKKRDLGLFNKIVNEMQTNPEDGQKIAYDTHYRVLRLFESYVKKGAPPDLSIDLDHMTGKNGNHDSPASVMRLYLKSDGKPAMESIDMNSDTPLEPGRYIVRHGATVWNAENKSSTGPKSRIVTEPTVVTGPAEVVPVASQNA